MTAALIVNPRSGGRNRRGLALAEMLRDAPVRVVVLEHFDALAPALAELGREGVEALFVSSGDGTVQEIQTRIAEDGLFARNPALCLLPHGTTNMTAADLGFGERALRAQRDFIQFSGWRRAGARTVMRPTVRIANPADGRARHGMFLGGAAIATATIYCQQRFNARGVRGGPANAATLAVAVMKSLFGGPAREGDDGRIDRPGRMSVRIGEEVVASGLQLAFLATTLHRLVLGARPFWGSGEGALRVSVFGHPPPRFLLRYLPAVLRGRGAALPQNMKSLRTDALEVEAEGSFILDGERFEPPLDAPLRISRGADFRYILG